MEVILALRESTLSSKNETYVRRGVRRGRRGERRGRGERGERREGREGREGREESREEGGNLGKERSGGAFLFFFLG